MRVLKFKRIKLKSAYSFREAFMLRFPFLNKYSYVSVRRLSRDLYWKVQLVIINPGQLDVTLIDSFRRLRDAKSFIRYVWAPKAEIEYTIKDIIE